MVLGRGEVRGYCFGLVGYELEVFVHLCARMGCWCFIYGDHLKIIERCMSDAGFLYTVREIQLIFYENRAPNRIWLVNTLVFVALSNSISFKSALEYFWEIQSLNRNQCQLGSYSISEAMN